MEIERLSFQVYPEDRVHDFMVADEKVWDPWLMQQKGFIKKIYTLYPEGRVDVRLFWAKKSDLKKAAENPEIPALDVRLKSEFLGVYTRLP